MADNITLNTGTGGAVLATDDIGSVHYQIIKVAFGALDTATLVTSGVGLPVNLVADYLTIVDDAAFVPGTSRVLPFAAEFDDVTPDSVDEGDAGAVRMSANRNLYVRIRDNAGNERGLNVDASGFIGVTDGAGSLTVDNGGTFAVQAAQSGTWNVGTVTTITNVVHVDDNAGSLTVDNAGTFAVQATIAAGAAAIAKAEDVASADADVGVPAMAVRKVTPANTSGTDGDYEMLQMSAGRLWVDPSGVTLTVASHAVTNAGTFAVQAVAAGDVAHDGADSGNPVKVGAVARQTNPTAVADGDRVNLYADDLGKLVNYPFAPRDRIVKGSRISLTSTTETTLIAAGGAGVFRDLIWLLMSNESATECRVDIRDVAAGTVLFSIDLAADGGGAVVALPVCWPQATANSAWTAQLSAAVSTVYVSGLAVENN